MQHKICIALLAVLIVSPAWAVEYFVGVNGSDKNPGTSEKAPFRTINHAIRKIVPGDIVTILPGEYHEEAQRNDLKGDINRPTVIRAKIPGTVHMRGDIPAPRFTKVPGRKNVYMCQVDKMPEYVLERDTVKRYFSVPSVSEVEMAAGTFFKDVKNKRIYIQTSDTLEPEKHLITFSVIRGDAIRFSGSGNKNIHISGIMFSGFHAAAPNPGYMSTFGGVFIRNAVNCSVKDCIVYLSGSGIIMRGVTGTTVENCVLFANHTDFNNSGGNLVFYGPAKNSTQRNIISFASNGAGVRLYSGKFLNCLIENCCAFDNDYGDIWIKPASNTSVVKGSYAGSLMQARRIENSIFTRGDTKYHGKAIKSICRERERHFDPEKEFVSPANLDFRLMENSIFRKGTGRGVKGYDQKVVFNDATKLVSGGTLYFSAPVKKNVVLRNLENITIRGRSIMPAVLKGDLVLENCKNVRLENVNVMGNASFKGCAGLTIRRSAFLKDVVIPANSQVRHNLFAGSVKGADDGFLRGNIFCVSYNGKPRFSGWNAYVKNNIPAFEVCSWRAPAPIFNNAAAGDLTLKNHYLFAGRSADGFPTGQYRYDVVSNYDGVTFETGNVSSSSATFLINSASQVKATVKLTAPGAASVSQTINTKGSGAFAFTGLRPGVSYKAVCTVIPTPEACLTNAPVNSAKSKKYTCTLKTLTGDKAPRVWHVSPKGDNANDGSSPAKALAEINAAIRRAGPGDTILIGSGVYTEQLRINSTGTKGKFLTIAGAPGADVVIDGCRMFCYGAQIINRKFIKIDNLRFIRLAGSGGTPDAGSIYIRNSSDIHISRILHDNRNGSSQRSFVGIDSKNILLENSVHITPFGGYQFTRCPNLEIRNCVFFRGKTLNGRVHTTAKMPAHVHHCIFAGQEYQKVKNPTFGANDIGTFNEHDNGFMIRLPRDEKLLIGFNDRNGKRLPSSYGSLEKLRTDTENFFKQTLSYTDYLKSERRKDTALFSDPGIKALSFFYRFKSLDHWQKQFFSTKPADKKFLNEARKKELQYGKEIKITDFIATAPEYRKRNIGLDPKAFEK
ncbi:MAG: DUF1565 domain-containing protein [Lentisphaeria bacterium]|nr:DUF1565 domain-containing protein [Lentisphaeria bacterium]